MNGEKMAALAARLRNESGVGTAGVNDRVKMMDEVADTLDALALEMAPVAPGDAVVLAALNAYEPNAATPNIEDWGEKSADRMRRVIEVVSRSTAPAVVADLDSMGHALFELSHELSFSDDSRGPDEARAHAERLVVQYVKIATVPDTATAWHDKSSAETAAVMNYELATVMQQQRDAALAAVERVRAIHKPEPTGRAEYVKNENGGITGTAETFVCPRGCNGSVWFFAGDECDTYKAAALDVASEPEWDYGILFDDPYRKFGEVENYTGCETLEGAIETAERLAGSTSTWTVWKRPMKLQVVSVPAGKWEVCE